MKKILLGIGALGTISAPLVTVIACGNDNKVDIKKDMQIILAAFNNTKGGRDVSNEWFELRAEGKRISEIKDIPTRTKEQMNFMNTLMVELSKIQLTIVNKMKKEKFHYKSDDVKQLFNGFKNELETIKTEKFAKEHGFKDLAQVAKSLDTATKMSNIQVAKGEDQNAINVGDDKNVE